MIDGQVALQNRCRYSDNMVRVPGLHKTVKMLNRTQGQDRWAVAKDIAQSMQTKYQKVVDNHPNRVMIPPAQFPKLSWFSNSEPTYCKRCQVPRKKHATPPQQVCEVKLLQYSPRKKLKLYAWIIIH